MRCRIRSILSDTLAPPRTATYGFSGWSRRRDRDAISASISRPAAGRGRCRVIPTTEACARWAVPKASFTYRSARAARRREKASSFFSDRKSTRLNSSHLVISYAVFCLKKKKKQRHGILQEISQQLQPRV